MSLRRYSIINLLMVVLFLGYYSSSTLFVHTHESGAGKITHSHPYVPSSTHSHSVAGLHLVEALSHLLFVAATAMVVAVTRTAYKIFFGYACLHELLFSIRLKPLRGPPATC